MGDGAHWLWETAALHFPEAVQVLDWYHLSEHIHETAKVLYGEGSEEAREWAETRLEELWSGKHLVGARRKLWGMRNWQRGNAEAVLALRAAIQDGIFDRLWSAHLSQAP